MIPHCVPAVWEAPRPSSRACSAFRDTTPDGCAIGILGLADDEGVRLNAGRVGARAGPGAIRTALVRYGALASPEPPCDWSIVFDAGDVVPAQTLEETHERVREAAAALLALGLFPIALGGGHDLTLPLVRAVHEHISRPLVGVYFDAHLDVRPEAGSGMGFRRLVELGAARELHVHGLDRFSNARQHLDWFRSHGGHIEAFDADSLWPAGDLFVSLDLDVIDQAHAPGVSAMNPCGWTPGHAERWVRAAARQASLRCFDIMELNPRVDEGGRTARLAARLLLAFIAEFARSRGLNARRSNLDEGTIR